MPCDRSPQCLEVVTVRQMDMQKFVADGCREALLEEKRRFCFLVDKHCNFSYHMSTFHDKVTHGNPVLIGKLFYCILLQMIFVFCFCP